MARFFAVGAALCGLLLSGCAAWPSGVPNGPGAYGQLSRTVQSAQPVPPSRTAYLSSAVPAAKSWMSPAAVTSKLVYVSTAHANVINVYNPTGTMLGQIAGSFLNVPDGMAVDSKGNLYVTNYGGGTVLVFAKGATTPKLTLSDPGTAPVDVVVSSGGTVFVSNGSGSGGPGFIDVYKPGQTKPYRTLQDTAADPLGLGITLDASGNLFWSLSTGRGGGFGQVDEFANAQGSPIVTSFILSRYPGGLAFDKTGNAVICDVGAPAVDVFPPGSSRPSRQYAQVGEPLFHAFDPAELNDYVADFTSLDIGVYDYASGTLKRKITKGLSSTVPPQGVAFDPRAKY